MPPPLQPPKLSHTPRGHTLAGGGPRVLSERQTMQADSLRLELKGMMSSYIVASDCRRVAGRLPCWLFIPLLGIWGVFCETPQTDQHVNSFQTVAWP